MGELALGFEGGVYRCIFEFGENMARTRTRAIMVGETCSEEKPEKLGRDPREPQIREGCDGSD